MLDATLYRGLANRLVGKLQVMAGKEAADSPILGFIAVTIATANYPNGAMRGGENIAYLTPCIPQEDIWLATEDFLDKGIGSLNELFSAIWGLSVPEYLAKIAETEPDDA